LQTKDTPDGFSFVTIFLSEDGFSLRIPASERKKRRPGWTAFFPEQKEGKQ
jgi:hypothetical protein